MLFIAFAIKREKLEWRQKWARGKNCAIFFLIKKGFRFDGNSPSISVIRLLTVLLHSRWRHQGRMRVRIENVMRVNGRQQACRWKPGRMLWETFLCECIKLFLTSIVSCLSVATTGKDFWSQMQLNTSRACAMTLQSSQDSTSDRRIVWREMDRVRVALSLELGQTKS